MKDLGDKTGSTRADALPEPATQSPPSVTIPIAERMARSSTSTYQTCGERAALRCSLGDAAALCDAIARAALVENRGRGGKGATTKLGLHLSAIATRCGDAVWAMRELIDVPHGAAQGIDSREASETALAGSTEGQSPTSQSEDAPEIGVIPVTTVKGETL